MEERIVYPVRHGVTEWNKIGVCMGWSEEGLHEDGIREAQELATKLKEKEIPGIYTSSVGRAVQTAEIMNRYLSTETTDRERYGRNEAQ